MNTPDDLLSDLVSLPTAANMLELHRATVNDMVLSGRLKGYRLGPHWYVRRADLEVFKLGYHRPKGAPRRRSIESRWYWTNEILRWLRHWHDATSGELETVVDLHVGNIRKYLSLSEHEGLVHRDDFGRWSLTVAGETRAATLPPIREGSTGTVVTVAS